ncbi:spore gernimation protein [Anoxybacillus ayderensis]|uniref:GerAB/ArcD/ProY family transporter n=1 Tax=Anoxybacillus sp. ST70 TaxID=2864180 RepID=UPI0002F0D22C|nr:endospore germination permease [Anoxybacillus sp. ST70]AXM88934.1 spore gernimation protein [Anoxybacillus ayderensis G10]MBW9218936.1 spore germination protein [Anoxybacillus sp. ST70]THD15954.1 spore gernimation protein [Anoxybacillus ayderensis]
MKRYQFNEITTMQYIFLISGTQVGIGILSLPAQLADIANTDGWIAIVMGWIISIIASTIIIKTMEKHEQDTIFDLSRRYFGRIFGTFLHLAFVAYALLASITVVFTSIHITQVWVLPNTPNYLIMMLFMLPGFFITRNGVRVLGRYAEVVFYLTLWMPILIAVPLQKGTILHMLPMLKEGWAPIIQAVKTTVLSFLGFELAFVFYPFLKEKKHAVKAMVIANSISAFTFLLITITCFIFFSPDETPSLIWPTLSLLKTIEFSFIERFEVIFLSFYLFVMSTTGIPYIFTTVFGISQLIGKKDHTIVLLVAVCIFIFTSFLYNPSYSHIQTMGSWWERYGLWGAYFFPIGLFIYTSIARWFQGGKNK